MSHIGLSKNCVLLACLGLCLMAALPAHGGVIIAASSVTVGAGTTGDSFDVLLTNTGPSAITVGSFSFNISTADTDISFTDVTTGTLAAPYIFVSSSLFGPDLTGPNSGQTFTSFPSDVSFPADVSIGASSTVGLGHVLFDVAGGAMPGTFAVTLVQDSSVTNLSNANGNIPINTFTDGDITISTPEPATVPLAGLAFLIAAAARRKLRARL